MKILYIANARMPTEKAHGLHIAKICEAFAKQGHEVTLAVPWRYNPIKKDPYEYYGVEKNFKIKKIFAIDLVRFGRFGYWIHYLSFAEFSAWYAMLSKYDVIYSRDALPLSYLTFFNKKLVWEIHTKQYNFFISRVLSQATHVISISNGLKQYYKWRCGYCAEKIEVVPDGFDASLFEREIDIKKERENRQIPPKSKVVGFVGKFTTMGEKKGVEELISAFPRVLKADSTAHLLLVGVNEEEKEAVADELKKRGISEDKYTLVAHVPQGEVAIYLQLSDVLVMNYPHSEHYGHYMSPLKLFEYMASNVPIVSTDLPSVREILDEETAVFVKPDDTDALAEGIVKILKDKDFADTLAQNAKKHSEQFSWDKRASKIIDHIST